MIRIVGGSLLATCSGPRDAVPQPNPLDPSTPEGLEQDKNMLNLVVAKGYVGRLLANDGVARYLERNHLDTKRELEGIIAAIRTDAVG